MEKGCSKRSSTSLAAYPTSSGARKTDSLVTGARECTILSDGADRALADRPPRSFVTEGGLRGAASRAAILTWEVSLRDAEYHLTFD
jgi:hypothetical protein